MWSFQKFGRDSISMCTWETVQSESGNMKIWCNQGLCNSALKTDIQSLIKTRLLQCYFSFLLFIFAPRSVLARCSAQLLSSSYNIQKCSRNSPTNGSARFFEDIFDLIRSAATSPKMVLFHYVVSVLFCFIQTVIFMVISKYSLLSRPPSKKWLQQDGGPRRGWVTMFVGAYK